jgi:hypothetical protein
MIVHNASTDAWRKAARKASAASNAAHMNSNYAANFAPDRPRLPQLAAGLARRALYSDHRNDPTPADRSNPEEMYKALHYHEWAMRIHETMMDHHEAQRLQARPGLETMDIHARMYPQDAMQAHDLAGQEAARYLGMRPEHYSAFLGLRDAMRKDPTDAHPRLVLADLLEEEAGLPKEALRLRSDPTGHISRAVHAFRRVMGHSPMTRTVAPHLDEYHRNAIRDSLRANRLNTDEAHERAERSNHLMGSMLGLNPDLRQLHPGPATILFGGIRAHNELATYHRQRRTHHE